MKKRPLLFAIMMAVVLQSAFAVTFDAVTVPTAENSNAEILDYCDELQILIANDTINSRVRFYKFDTSDPNEPMRLICLSESIKAGGEPTSVSACPGKLLGFAAILDDDKRKNGSIIAYDLSNISGEPAATFTAGIGPDCVDVSPDGKWLLAADEAQSDSVTPGSISCANLTGVSSKNIKDMKLTQIKGLSEVLKLPAGIIEPEFIAFDPQSRFATITCQENDLIVLIDLQKSEPKFVGKIDLPACSEPDGVDVLDGIAGPYGQDGCLIGTAEEGRKNKAKKRKGQTAAFYYVDPNDYSSQLACRLDVRKALGLPLTTRCDPEGIVMGKIFGKTLAFIGIERQNCVLCLDITTPSSPVVLGKIPTGSRPEGIILLKHDGAHYLITANESTGANGSFTICRIEK